MLLGLYLAVSINYIPLLSLIYKMGIMAVRVIISSGRRWFSLVVEPLDWSPTVSEAGWGPHLLEP